MSEIGDNGGPPLMRGGDGWVAIHRSMRDHWLVGFGKPVKPMNPDMGALSRAEAWIDLIMECRYEAGTVNNGGRKMVLDPGQLLGAISWLANRWNWSPQTVRTFIEKLESDGMIERRSPVATDDSNKHNGKQANVISICKYSDYQIVPDVKKQAEQQASNKQATSKQQASNNNTKDNKGTKEQVLTPLPPEGGERQQSALEMFGEPPPEEDKDAATKRDVRAAFEVYNLAAKHFGFAECSTLTDARQKRLAKRLTAIGGLEAFKVALRSLAREEPFTRFLRGRAPPRPGDQPFRLDIDRLMQTDGNLGDVLAKLADIGKQSAAPIKPPWSDWSREEWREKIATHANGIWPLDKIGYWPGHPECAAPDDLIRDMQASGDLGEYDENGICRGH